MPFLNAIRPYIHTVSVALAVALSVKRPTLQVYILYYLCIWTVANNGVKMHILTGCSHLVEKGISHDGA